MTPESAVNVTPEMKRKLTLPNKFQSLPFPPFIKEAPDTNGRDEMVRWIGFEIESLDGKAKRFLWAYNLRGLNLRDPIQRSALAQHITVKKLRDQEEITIGPAIDIEKNDQETGGEEIITKRGYYGIYVEETKRPGYNFREIIGGVVASPGIVRDTFGQQYLDTFNQISLLLKKLAS